MLASRLQTTFTMQTVGGLARVCMKATRFCYFLSWSQTSELFATLLPPSPTSDYNYFSLTTLLFSGKALPLGTGGSKSPLQAAFRVSDAQNEGCNAGLVNQCLYCINFCLDLWGKLFLQREPWCRERSQKLKTQMPSMTEKLQWPLMKVYT